ncbi:hypothetical protein ABZP36_003762, partial [Zizania latifolia]
EKLLQRYSGVDLPVNTGGLSECHQCPGSCRAVFLEDESCSGAAGGLHDGTAPLAESGGAAYNGGAGQTMFQVNGRRQQQQRQAAAPAGGGGGGGGGRRDDRDGRRGGGYGVSAAGLHARVRAVLPVPARDGELPVRRGRRVASPPSSYPRRPCTRAPANASTDGLVDFSNAALYEVASTRVAGRPESVDARQCLNGKLW